MASNCRGAPLRCGADNGINADASDFVAEELCIYNSIEVLVSQYLAEELFICDSVEVLITLNNDVVGFYLNDALMLAPVYTSR